MNKNEDNEHGTHVAKTAAGKVYAQMRENEFLTLILKYFELHTIIIRIFHYLRFFIIKMA